MRTLANDFSLAAPLITADVVVAGGNCETRFEHGNMRLETLQQSLFGDDYAPSAHDGHDRRSGSPLALADAQRDKQPYPTHHSINSGTVGPYLGQTHPC